MPTGFFQLPADTQQAVVAPLLGRQVRVGLRAPGWLPGPLKDVGPMSGELVMIAAQSGCARLFLVVADPRWPDATAVVTRWVQSVRLAAA